MVSAMRRALRIAAAPACLAAALVCHETFSEWRTERIPAEHRAALRARILLPLREVRHAEGNAAEWDAAERVVRSYDRDWLACHHELRGDPAPGDPLAVCLGLRPYTIVGATAEAVARAECELELHGSLPERAPLEACVRARGHRETPIPRWPYERLGPRFAGPWVEETALFAEREVANVRVPRAAAIVLGLAVPVALCAAAFVLLRAARPRRAP
jgi:hypothetical protein